METTLQQKSTNLVDRGVGTLIQRLYRFPEIVYVYVNGKHFQFKCEKPG